MRCSDVHKLDLETLECVGYNNTKFMTISLLPGWHTNDIKAYELETPGHKLNLKFLFVAWKISHAIWSESHSDMQEQCQIYLNQVYLYYRHQNMYSVEGNPINKESERNGSQAYL